MIVERHGIPRSKARKIVQVLDGRTAPSVTPRKRPARGILELAPEQARGRCRDLEAARFLKKRKDTVEKHPRNEKHPCKRPERRALADRRWRPTRLLSTLRWRGQRSGFRRDGEGRNRYVDQPLPRVALLVLAAVFFSSFDALFTLLHIGNGGYEVNPLMESALLAGVGVFVAVKTLLTDVGVLFLAIHQNFRLAWLALHVTVVLYAFLLAYHTSLFSHAGA